MVRKRILATAVGIGMVVGAASAASAASHDPFFPGFPGKGPGKAAPGPVAGAGISFLLIAASYVVFRRRRQNQSDQARR